MQLLDGLDDIDWHELHHAFGRADDVPAILRSLSEGDPGAIGHLWGNIYHQGTVYPATASAVPFLIRLLALPHLRVDIAALLAEIAVGTSYLDVHGPTTRQRVEDFEVERAQELRHVQRARDAVKAGEPVYSHWLEHGDAAQRAAMTALLARTLESAEPLLARLQTEPEAWVRTELALQVWHCHVDARTQLTRLREARTPMERFVGELAAGERRDTRAWLEVLPDPELATVPWVQQQDGPLLVALRTSAGEGVYDLVGAALHHPRLLAEQKLEVADELVRSRRGAARLAPAIVDFAEAGGGADALRVLRPLGTTLPTHPYLEAMVEMVPDAYSEALPLLLQIRHPAAGRVLRAALDRWAEQGTLDAQLIPWLRLAGPWAPGLAQPLLALVGRELATRGRGNKAPSAVIAGVGNYAPTPESVERVVAQHETHPAIVARVLRQWAPDLSITPSVRNALDTLRRGHPQVRMNAMYADPTCTPADRVDEALRQLAEAVRVGQFSHAFEVLLHADPRPEITVVFAKHLNSPSPWISGRCALGLALAGHVEAALPVLKRTFDATPMGLELVRWLPRLGLVDPFRTSLEAELEGDGLRFRHAHETALHDAENDWVHACRVALAS